MENKTMTPDDLKKDCERKARAIVDRFYKIDDHTQLMMVRDMADKVADAIAEALYSEHLIVQKRVGGIDKSEFWRSEFITADTKIKELQKQIDELKDELIKTQAQRDERGTCLDILQSKIDELTKENERLKHERMEMP